MNAADIQAAGTLPRCTPGDAAAHRSPPCPCTRGFGCGSTGRCHEHTGAFRQRPPGSDRPSWGGSTAGGSAWPRGWTATRASSVLLLLRGQHGWTRAWGEPRPPRPFDQALQEAPPLRPGSPRPKLLIIPGFSTFFVCVWKKHPHRQPTGYGNSVCHCFFPKALKSQASFSSGWFPVGSVATLSNMAAWPVPLMAGCALGTLWGLHHPQ